MGGTDPTGVCWTLNFMRGCREINKICSNLELFVKRKKKTEKEMTDRFVLCVLLSVCL